MKLLKAHQELTDLVSLASGVTCYEFDVPDYGSMVGFQVTDFCVSPLTGDSMVVTANGEAGYGVALANQGTTGPTDIISCEGLLAIDGIQATYSAADSIPFYVKPIQIMAHDVVDQIWWLVNTENITTTNIYLKAWIRFDVYQLSQAEWIKFLA